ncbi:MAG: spore coat protein [Oscillospiraceae bacterium]
MNQPIKPLTDQEIMEDILGSQKHITGTYNEYANECVDPMLRDDFLKILREEHNIQSTVYTDMQKRCWYSPKQAEQQMINQTKTKFKNIAQQL